MGKVLAETLDARSQRESSASFLQGEEQVSHLLPAAHALAEGAEIIQRVDLRVEQVQHGEEVALVAQDRGRRKEEEPFGRAAESLECGELRAAVRVQRGRAGRDVLRLVDHRHAPPVALQARPTSSVPRIRTRSAPNRETWNLSSSSSAH